MLETTMIAAAERAAEQRMAMRTDPLLARLARKAWQARRACQDEAVRRPERGHIRVQAAPRPPQPPLYDRVRVHLLSL